MGSVTPLVVVFWAWMTLAALWFAGSWFVVKTRRSEGWLGRAGHLVPLFAGFYLLFAKRSFGPADYRLYVNNAVGWLGAIVAAAGVLFAIWARVTLGRYWSGAITLKKGHRLIRTGPYAVARHPIYTGFVVGALGTAISAARVDAFIGFAIITLALVLKLRREEAFLAEEFGEEYVRFKREVPALFPLGWLSAEANRPIESEAFQRAVLRSDRYRIIGMLCVCAAFAVLDVAIMLSHPDEARRYLVYLVWWGTLAAYEAGLLMFANRSRRRGRPIRLWVWAVNTAVECLLPSLALLGLTGDVSYLGPYRALVSSTVGIYFCFIILSTLRLTPLLCIIAGTVCAVGYAAVYLFTLWVAPRNNYRHVMPERIFVMYPVILAGAGLLAAAVAWQIRQHVIAALAEAETRRTLDRIRYDLNVARSIQMGLLPQVPPTAEGYDIAGWSEPAEQTGGDYYDWFELPDSRLMFTIADVAGHGIGPALLAAACRAYFRAIAVHGNSLERMVQRVEGLVATDVPGGRFITAAVAALDTAEHRLSLYSAGHAPLYLYTAATDRVTSLEADQPPLGASLGADDPDARARVISLAPGDALVLVTDGFFECQDGTGERLGTSRLAEIIRAGQADSARELIARMHRHVVDFSHGRPQPDDLTAVVIKRRVI